MKLLFAPLFLLISLATQAQLARHLVKVWETDTIIPIPESVLPDEDQKTLYVSLIDGEPWGADGKGGIAKLTSDGKIVNLRWVEGLNAPKGMGQYKGKLYVADITDLVIIDIKAGKVEERLPISDSKGLNDVTIDSKGVVYVSDSEMGKVFKIENARTTVHVDGIKGINGIKSSDDNLFILASPNMYKIGSGKKAELVASGLEQGADGIEAVGNGDFIVSCWGGLIYYVSSNGEKRVLLDTQQEKMNTADIGFITGKNIVLIPTFFKKSVAAFHLK